MIRAIFFDFNGVIIDDEKIQMKAFQEVLREHDVNITEEWYFDSLGMDDRTFVRSMFSRAGKPPLVTRASHIFRRRPGHEEIEPVMTGGMDNPVDVAFSL